MSFDVNAAARQLGVDPSKITASADGSTYTVTANGVTKTYKASGDGENSVFTEQAAQTSGSGTPAASSGSGGSITVDQSIWSQNMSALSSNLQGDLFMNSGLMSGIPNMPDNSGNLFQIIQNLMNAINIQMPTMPTVQTPVIPTVVDPTTPGTSPTTPGTSPGASDEDDSNLSSKEKFIKDHKLVEGDGHGWDLKGIYYADNDGKITDDDAEPSECYVWDAANEKFVKYTKQSDGKYKTGAGDTYKLVRETRDGAVSGSFKKISLAQHDTADVQRWQSEASDVAYKLKKSFEYFWGTDKDEYTQAAGADPNYHGSKITKDNIMYVIDEYKKLMNGEDLFDRFDDETGLDRTYESFYKPVTKALADHARDIADQLDDNELRNLASTTEKAVEDTNYDDERNDAIHKLIDAIRLREPTLQRA